MRETEFRNQVRRWIAELTDKQFTEFFYDVVKCRCTSDLPNQRGHFVLADASFDLDVRRWAVDFVALPNDKQRWADDAPLCQAGECPTCSNDVRSWAKDQVCPICDAAAYGT